MENQKQPPADRVDGVDRVEISENAIDTAALLDAVADPAAGAVVLFLGTVRDHSEAKPGVTRLEYEVYGEFVELKIVEITERARRKWDLCRIAIVHRVGSLEVGETSVAVAVSAGHRPSAFEAGRYLIDELKATAPIWKKEHWEGGAEWVREDRHHAPGAEDT